MTEISCSAGTFHIHKRMDTYRDKQSRRRHERNYLPVLWNQGTFEKKCFPEEFHTFCPFPSDAKHSAGIRQHTHNFSSSRMFKQPKLVNTPQERESSALWHLSFPSPSSVWPHFEFGKQISFPQHKELNMFLTKQCKFVCVSVNWASSDRSRDLPNAD